MKAPFSALYNIAACNLSEQRLKKYINVIKENLIKDFSYRKIIKYLQKLQNQN